MADKILIVEDNDSLRAGIKVSFEEAGYAVHEASSGMEAVRKLETESYHVVVSDIKLGDLTGVDILKKAKEVSSETEVILMTAYATVETAVQALRLGAFDYIQKPFEIDHLIHCVKTARKMGSMKGELDFFQKSAYRSAMEDDALVAESRGMKEILNVIRKVAPTTATILVTGETGTGKELLATLIHFGSPRAKCALVKVNCAALHENLLESELFGHEKGAFTGAERLRIGRFEQADKGTIFLDEIGDMSSTTQAKVLRVLQEQEFERLGSSGKSIKVDVRVVAATNKDMRTEVKEGRFRQDLFFRLNVVNLHVPPLRERAEDILPLARFFLNRYAVEFKKKVTTFSPAAIGKLRSYNWPGNVRELQNAIERAVLLCEYEMIEPSSLTMEGRPDEDVLSPGDVLNLEKLERAAIMKALHSSGGIQKEAARLLGISARVLNYKIQSLGIDWKTYRMHVP
ncbi:MAG: sigma-54-dependent Fis family transcriptional regulator [Deltaproteobacteria bacterium]|nr:sigma-54-dependent Fis family transcriptional regulator [Deltaproteobacteria bacterium]